MKGKDLDGTSPLGGDGTDAGAIRSLRELDQRLGAAHSLTEVLDSLAEAITIRDPSNRIVYANRAAVEQMGFGSREELLGRPPQSIFDDYVVRGEDGRELKMEDIPSVRLLAGDRVEPLLMRTVQRSTGIVKWNLLKAAAIRDSEGNAVAAGAIIEDVTSGKVAALRERVVARAAATLMPALCL